VAERLREATARPSVFRTMGLVFPAGWTAGFGPALAFTMHGFGR
jgi:hypothetical protein